MTDTSIPILMYHSISDSTNPRFGEFAVAPARFVDQMNYLSHNGYTSLTVSQWVAAMQTGRRLDRVVVLTFDDGYADFHSNTLPVLKHLGLTATLYVTTGYVGQTSAWLGKENEGDRPMLTWGQLAEISAAGIECGGHTHTHVPLDAVSLRTAKQEIETCKRTLERELGKPVTSFAYPFGYYTPAVRQMVIAAGYTSACAVRYARSSTNDDPWSLARLIVSGTRVDFDKLLEGADSIRRFQQMRSRAWRLLRRSAFETKRAFDRSSSGQA